MPDEKKNALSKLFYYCIIHPFIWVTSKLHRLENLSKEEKTLSDELAEAYEEDKKMIELEISGKIKQLPPDWQRWFKDLGISVFNFFLAAHAIELLIKRTFSHPLNDDVWVILSQGGAIGFRQANNSWLSKKNEIVDI